MGIPGRSCHSPAMGCRWTADTAVPPPFRPRPPWWGGDLQTLRNFLIGPRRPARSAPTVRMRFEMSDGTGDVLLGALDRGERGGERPLVVLIHGLTGCEDSAYILASAAACLDAGADVLRLNLRGAGPSRGRTREQYHAGRSADLFEVMDALAPEAAARGILLVGYSLGGNLVLKFLAEHPGRFPISAALSVSAPIDPAAASRRLMAPRNALYQRYLLAGMKREGMDGKVLSPAERRAVARARSVHAFDDTFTGPRNGYDGAEDYYTDSAALGRLGAIRTPTVMIHADNDPWIPAASYREAAASASGYVRVVFVGGGGHVGFHGRGSPIAWHDRFILALLTAESALSPP